MGASSYSTLQGSVFRSETEASLTINSIFSQSSFENFCYAFRFNTSVHSLHIVGNPGQKGRSIGTMGAETLFAALQANKTLTELALPWNKIGDKGSRALCYCIHYAENTWRTPFVVDIGHNELGDISCEHLAQVLAHNKSIETLRLSGNRITSKGVKLLGHSLTINFTLQNLIIGDNMIDDKGFQILAEAIATTSTIERLDLQENVATYLGIESIADGLVRRSKSDLGLRLKWLRIDFAWLHLPELVGSGDFRELCTLDLRGRQYGIFDAVVVGKLLTINESCKVLKLSKNNLGGRGCHPQNRHRLQNPLKPGRLSARVAAQAATAASMSAKKALHLALASTRQKSLPGRIMDMVRRTKVLPKPVKQRRAAKLASANSVVRLMKEMARDDAYPWQDCDYFTERAFLLDWESLPSRHLRDTLRAMNVAECDIPDRKRDRAKMIMSITDLRDVFVSVSAQIQANADRIRVERELYDEEYKAREEATRMAKKIGVEKDLKKAVESYRKGKKMLKVYESKHGSQKISAEMNTLRKRLRALASRIEENREKLKDLRPSMKRGSNNDADGEANESRPDDGSPHVNEEIKDDNHDDNAEKRNVHVAASKYEDIVHDFEDLPIEEAEDRDRSTLQPGQDHLAGIYWLIRALASNCTLKVMDVRETVILRHSANIVAKWCSAALADNVSLVELRLGHKTLRVQELMRCRHHLDACAVDFSLVDSIDLRPTHLRADDREIALELVKLNRTHLKCLNGIRIVRSSRCELQNRPLHPYEVAFVASQLKGHLLLRDLNLSNASIRADELPLICSAIRGNESITSINLSYNAIGGDALCRLMAIVASRKKLRHLYFQNCAIGPGGGVSIFKAVRSDFPSLETLVMDSNELGLASIDIVTKLLAKGSPPKLKTLSLSRVCVTDECCKHLANALENRKCRLEALILSCNPSITNSGVQRIARALRRNRMLKILDLSGDPLCSDETSEISPRKLIDHVSITDLSEMLKMNTTLTSLMLTNRSIGPCGVRSLADALQLNSTLKKLSIGHKLHPKQSKIDTMPWQIGTIGIAAFWKTFRHRDQSSVLFCVEELDISGNGLEDEAFEALVEFLEFNAGAKTTFRYLNVSDNVLSGPMAKRLVEHFSSAHVYKYIDLKRNFLTNEERKELRSQATAKRFNMKLHVDPPFTSKKPMHLM